MARINALRVSFVTYQHPDIPKIITFLQDFGLHEVAREEGKRYYFAGFGEDQYSYVAEQSPDTERHFIGGTFTVESQQDFANAAAHPQASKPVDNPGPGGGKIVAITDPDGFLVSFIYGQEKKAAAESYNYERITRDKDRLHAEIVAVPNSAFEKARKGKPRRFDPGPSPVHKLGHYGYETPNFAEMFEWYTSLMNLKPTDAVFDEKTGKDKTCFLHLDRGETYVDHHAFFLSTGGSGTAPHVHHSSFEVNDFDSQSLGHDFLESKGWKNCWGIGRHVLGSQIFDYWFDASGNVIEHYADGDVVNSKTAHERIVEAPDSLYVWGPNIPLAFVTGKVEHAGAKLLAPDVENAVPTGQIA